MPLEQPFSKRNRFQGGPKEITVREDAPENLRYFVLETARDLGWRPTALRNILCRVLRARPDAGNWSEYPNIWDEVQELMYGCDWFKVYDIIEVLHANLAQADEYSGEDNAGVFARDINEFFIDEGIGWQIVDGKIVTRGSEAFQTLVTEAASALATERPTAAKHLHEALEDLSRRPQADLPGAAYHAMGSLECVARDLTGDPKARLGDILKRYPRLLPKPLDEALSKVWGYASNEARHVVEGREISREEAELLVGLSATVSTYLLRKPVTL
jgi:AbiJ-like protein